MMKPLMLQRILLYGSLLALLYFIFLVAISFYKIESGILRFIGEIITLPLLLLVLCSMVYSVIMLFRTGERKGYVLIFGINLVTIIMLVATTYLQMNT